eukprot:853831-Pyramimonas_sp.AAC.1
MAEPMMVDDETMRMRKGKGVATNATEALDSSPWVEKYRPKTLADVAAHKDIIDTSKTLVDEAMDYLSAIFSLNSLWKS